MKKKLSIIIPAYNCEKYIDSAIESIVKDKNDNIEILVINDGSIDNTRKIVNNYCKKDSRIKLINKENTGVSDSRNVGIKKSSGDYILFVDADDYLENDYYKNIEIEIANSKYDIIYYSKKYCKQKFDNKRIFYGMFQLDKEFSNFSLGTVWSKVYKKSFIINNKILFDTKITHSEDILFNAMLLSNNPKTKIVGKCIYNYRINNNSVTSQPYIENINSVYRKKIIELKNDLVEDNRYFINHIDIYLMLSVINAVSRSKNIVNGIKIIKQYMKKNNYIEAFKFSSEHDIYPSYNKISSWMINKKIYFGVLVLFKLKNFLKTLKNQKEYIKKI